MARTGNERIRVYAPGGIGNLGPALDVLGCAVAGRGDIVEVAWANDHGGEPIRIVDPGHPELPTDATRHTSAIAAAAVARTAGIRQPGTMALRVEKGLPLAGGQGGSAASAVAGAVAANLLLGTPLAAEQVLAAALEAESAVAGRHGDNLAAAFYGGVVLVRSLDPIDVVRVPFPPGLRAVLVHPAQRLRTADARAALPNVIDRATVIQQTANVAALVAALVSGDLALLARALDDRIAEPARAPLLPGFREAKGAALAAGAIGCSISGAGPTSFAFADDDARAARIARAMCEAYAACGITASARVGRIDEQGARRLPNDVAVEDGPSRL